jgi:metal-dependent amidase/aminoacylase/carboxypeptidase family protein
MNSSGIMNYAERRKNEVEEIIIRGHACGHDGIRDGGLW